MFAASLMPSRIGTLTTCLFGESSGAAQTFAASRQKPIDRHQIRRLRASVMFSPPKTIVATSGGDFPKVKRVPQASDSGCAILSAAQRKLTVMQQKSLVPHLGDGASRSAIAEVPKPGRRSA